MATSPDIEPSVDRRWRRRLRRLGRQDGRRRHPDPAFEVAPIRTSTRRQLEAEMRYRAEVAWSASTKKIADNLVRAEGIAVTLPLLEERVQQAEDEVERIQREEPDVTAPVNRFKGEEESAEGLLRRRRFREFERRRNDARGVYLTTLAEVQRARRTITGLEAEASELARQAVDTTRRIAAVYQSAYEIYQQALLRRHVERELVLRLLDATPIQAPRELSEPIYRRLKS